MLVSANFMIGLIGNVIFKPSVKEKSPSQIMFSVHDTHL